MAKFCSSCGKQLNGDGDGKCPSCNTVSDQGADMVLKGAAFCIPLVGIVLYFVWKDTKPKASKDACTWALIGTGVGVVVYGFLAVIGLLANI